MRLVLAWRERCGPKLNPSSQSPCKEKLGVETGKEAKSWEWRLGTRLLLSWFTPITSNHSIIIYSLLNYMAAFNRRCEGILKRNCTPLGGTSAVRNRVCLLQKRRTWWLFQEAS